MLLKCHCKSRRKYFSHAFCWNVRPFATPEANPVANATCTLNVGGGHGRLISPNLASATSHENWFNQIQVVPVAACQTCSCRDRRLRRNEDPQNGHYEPCRFDKHLDQIQHWMMQTTAVTVDNRWFKSFQISVWSKMLLRNQTQLFWWKGIHCSSNPKQFESAQSLSKIAVNLSIQMQHHVSSRNDSKMPWIFEISGFWFPPRRVDHHVLLPNEENDSHWPGDGDIVWTVEYRFHKFHKYVATLPWGYWCSLSAFCESSRAQPFQCSFRVVNGLRMFTRCLHVLCDEYRIFFRVQTKILRTSKHSSSALSAVGASKKKTVLQSNIICPCPCFSEVHTSKTTRIAARSSTFRGCWRIASLTEQICMHEKENGIKLHAIIHWKYRYCVVFILPSQKSLQHTSTIGNMFDPRVNFSYHMITPLQSAGVSLVHMETPLDTCKMCKK